MSVYVRQVSDLPPATFDIGIHTLPPPLIQTCHIPPPQNPPSFHPATQECVPGAQRLLAAARAAGLKVVHTLEAHRPDLSDLHPSKLTRGKLPEGLRIGDDGTMGRILVAGEHGGLPWGARWVAMGRMLVAREDAGGRGARWGVSVVYVH